MCVCFVIVYMLLDYEMLLYIMICVVVGIDVEYMICMFEVVINIVYMCYVMDVGVQGDFLDLLFVLMFCVLGYGEIGVWFVCEVGDMFYCLWIDIYGGVEYQDVCVKVGVFLDSVIVKCLGDDL